jgi:putative transposase
VASVPSSHSPTQTVQLHTVHDERLSQTPFNSVSAAQESATRWLWTYNHERQNMAIRGITPMQKLAIAA